MQKLICAAFALSLFVLIEVNAQSTSSEGIRFEQTDWENTLKLAKEQDKLIFVDAYTTWCGPCKTMSRNVFTQKQVGDFYNDQFVNVKIDMEKGEGILFAKAYDVNAYPTFLFIDAAGNLIHKGLGSQPAESFIGLGEAATDPDRQLGTLMSRYEAGDRDPDLIRKYAEALAVAYMPEKQEEVAMAYLKSQDDWLQADNAQFVLDMANTDLDSELLQYVAKNREQIRKVVDDAAMVDQKLKYAVQMRIYRHHREDMNDRAALIGVYKMAFPENLALQYTDEFMLMNMSRAQSPEEQQQFIEAAVKHMDRYEVTDWQLLNQIAWRIYEISDDPALLKKAKGWAKASIDLDSNYLNNDTLAALYYKLKDKDAATKYALKAIEIAKETGGDTQGTEELLEKIKMLQ